MYALSGKCSDRKSCRQNFYNNGHKRYSAYIHALVWMNGTTELLLICRWNPNGVGGRGYSKLITEHYGVDNRGSLIYITAR